MVVPREICNAAANAERDRVLAWLDAGGSINDVDESGYTLHYGEDGTAEDILERRESLESSVGLAGNEHWIKIKALVHGVRQHGSYKRYARSFHRDVLTVRGLAQRGKLSTDDSVLYFLARIGLVDHIDLFNSFRYAVVGMFVVSAVITPPDILSQCLMAGPLVLLYGVGIVLAYFFSTKERDEPEQD